MENTDINLKQNENSAVWDSNKGSCSEAPDGAAGQNPVEQRASETHLIGAENLSSCSQTQENLEGLTEKVGTLDLQVERIAEVLPRPSLRRLLVENQSAVNLGPLQVINH